MMMKVFVGSAFQWYGNALLVLRDHEKIIWSSKTLYDNKATKTTGEDEKSRSTNVAVQVKYSQMMYMRVGEEGVVKTETETTKYNIVVRFTLFSAFFYFLRKCLQRKWKNEIRNNQTVCDGGRTNK